MEDGVKFIFRTLIKVPVWIMVFFLIFNLLAFSVVYFRLLGFSYVVMQTAVENNFLPTTERTTLNNYLQNSFGNIPLIENPQLVLIGDPTNPNESQISATSRRQYGSSVTVGVQAQFKWAMPLDPKAQMQDSGVNASGEIQYGNGVAGYGPYSSGTFAGYADAAELQARRDASTTRANIRITYTVPGLKYYPDMVD